MKTIRQPNSNQATTATKAREGRKCALIYLMICSLMVTDSRADDYQYNALLAPSSYQLQAEENGRVMIYDQMRNDTVETALNQHFDRIENMMFVRTQHVSADGTVKTDDDCD